MNKQTNTVYNVKVDILIRTGHLMGVPSQSASDVDVVGFLCIRQNIINLSSAAPQQKGVESKLLYLINALPPLLHCCSSIFESAAGGEGPRQTHRTHTHKGREKKTKKTKWRWREGLGRKKE